MAADALDVPPSVAAVEAKLRTLLQRARAVKTVDTVEPPLPASDLAQDVTSFSDGSLEATPSAQRSVVLETAARKVFYEILHTTLISDLDFVQMWNLLDVLILCSEHDHAEPILTFYLIEELLESQTTDGCKIVFDFLESRRERLMQRDFYKTHLVVLRACNDLLRRLSRAEDAVFCGRVFFFLFQSFPLGDKSSVNLRGEFHIDNVTSFEKDLEPLPTDDGTAEKMEIDESLQPTPIKTEQTDTKNESTTEPRTTSTDPTNTSKADNSALYPVFWRLQQDFSVPTRLFEDAHFAVFKQGLEQTMAKFEQTPVVVQTKAVSDEQRGTKRKHGQDDGHKFNTNYNPKYLTSRDLFELELSDLAFQRHILVQALILVDFLMSLTEKAKAKIAAAGIPKMNQSLLYQYTLSDDNTTWVKATRNKIANYLQNGPDGNFYYRMVNTVLSRDKNWVRWKIANCPSIVSDAVPAEQFLDARASVRRSVAVPRMRAKPMGAVDLTFLTEAENAKGLERLKDPARFTPPSIKELVNGIETDQLDLEMAMTDEEKQSLETARDSKTWRALRVAARTSLSKLERVKPGESLKSVFEKEEAPEIAADDTAGVASESKTPEIQVAS